MGMECPYLADAWKRAVGLLKYDMEEEHYIMPSLAVLRKTEWSDTFEEAMRVRLIVGAFRYGRLGDLNKPTYDRLGSIARRIALYRTTKNKELLVDIANFCLCEFVEGDGVFEPVDDGEHVRTLT